MSDHSKVSTINPRLKDLEPPPGMGNVYAWLCWRAEMKPGATKLSKVPYYANRTRRRGKHGDPEDREKLVTFEVAKAAAVRYGFTGVGIAILPGSSVAALDFDNVVQDPGIFKAIQRDLSNTYAEFSPSGNGVRAFVLQPQDVTKRFQNLKSHAKNDNPFTFEVFATSGFVTYTGNVLTPETGPVEVAEAAERIRKLYDGRLAKRGPVFGKGVGGGTLAARSSVAPLGYSIEEITHILKEFNPSASYDEWIEAGMCVHHETEGSQDGFDAWHTWSSTGDSYVSEGDCEAHCLSFNKTVGAKTIRTLLKKASLVGAKVGSPVATADDFDAMPPEENGEAELDTPSEWAEEKLARFTPIPAGEYVSRPAANHIIEDMIVAGDLVLLFGPSGGGKSFVAIDLGMAIARGIDWNGKETQQGTVVYVCCEGEGSFPKRLQAYSKARDVDLKPIPFSVIPATPNLLEERDVKDLLRDIQKAGGAHLVIIDTMAKAMVDGDENTSTVMGQVLRNAEFIGKQLGATVILVHHVGKEVSKGPRGHSSLKATMGTQIEIQYNKDKNERIIHLEKAKDGDDGIRWSFKLQVVELDKEVKRSGEVKVITSCSIIVDPVPIKRLAAIRSPAGSFTKMRKWEALIFEMMEEMASNGQKVNCLALKVAVMKAGVARFHVKSKSAEKGFGEALKELLFKKLVARHSGNVRLVTPDMGSQEDDGPRSRQGQ